MKGIPHNVVIELTPAQADEFAMCETQGRAPHYCASLVYGGTHRTVTQEQVRDVQSYNFAVTQLPKKIKIALPKGKTKEIESLEPANVLKISLSPFESEEEKAEFETTVAKAKAEASKPKPTYAELEAEIAALKAKYEPKAD